VCFNEVEILRRKKGKTHGSSYLVMAGLIPAIPIIGALCPPDRDRRDKPGDDEPAAASFAPVALWHVARGLDLEIDLLRTGRICRDRPRVKPGNDAA